MGAVKSLASRIIYRPKALRSSSPEENDFRHFQEDYFDRESKKKMIEGSLITGRGTEDRGCPRFPSPKGVSTAAPALPKNLLSSTAKPTCSPGDPRLLTVLLKDEHRLSKEQAEGGR